MISPVIVVDISKQSMCIPVSITYEDWTVKTNALINSDIGGLFIDKSFARQLKLPLLLISHPILVFNVDSTPNVNGTIIYKVTGDLIIAGNKQKSELLATLLGNEIAILGLPWLKSQKAIIDWAKETLDLDPNWFTDNPREDVFDTDILVWYIWGDPIDSLQLPDSVWIGTTNPAQEFAEWNATQKNLIKLDEFLWNYLHNFRGVFEKKVAEWFPILQPYNHAIELKSSFILRNCKPYSLSPCHKKAMNDFVNENLWKGYICKSTSPMASVLCQQEGWQLTSVPRLPLS